VPRNGSGTYQVPNTIDGQITAGPHNANYTDAGAEITNSLALDGQSIMSGPIKAASGTVGAPGIAFGSDTDSGLYRIGGDNIGVTCGGAKVLDVATTGLGVTGALDVSGALTLGTDLGAGRNRGEHGRRRSHKSRPRHGRQPAVHRHQYRSRLRYHSGAFGGRRPYGRGQCDLPRRRHRCARHGWRNGSQFGIGRPNQPWRPLRLTGQHGGRCIQRRRHAGCPALSSRPPEGRWQHERHRHAGFPIWRLRHGAVTDNGTGNYTLSLDTAFANTNYWCTVFCRRHDDAEDAGLASARNSDTKPSARFRFARLRKRYCQMRPKLAYRSGATMPKRIVSRVQMAACRCAPHPSQHCAS
jgi:hypothetical protein